MSFLWICFCVFTMFAVSTAGSCPKGWQTFKGSCYFLNTEKKLWIDARKYCASLGAHLARVESAEENMFFKRVYLGKSNFFWVDGTDIHKEGDWIWSSTSEPIVYKNWDKDQPDNAKSNQDYTGLRSSGKWDDGSVTHVSMSICEMDAIDKKKHQGWHCSNFLLEELVKCRKNQ